MYTELLEEFRLDWTLSGRASSTAHLYVSQLADFLSAGQEHTLAGARLWLAQTTSTSVRRKRGQALRAFGRWCTENGIDGWSWTQNVPLVNETVTPQTTVVESDYKAAIAKCRSPRDRAVIELLWSCGLRRGELAALATEDVNLSGGYIVVRRSKTGRPRVVPLAPPAIRSLRVFMRQNTSGSLLRMTSNAVRLLLLRLEAPSAHAWRRGWAVRALAAGVSEASVRAAAGWSSGAMVARYTAALSEELALSEFRHRWNEKAT
jgi:integrase